MTREDNYNHQFVLVPSLNALTVRIISNLNDVYATYHILFSSVPNRL